MPPVEKCHQFSARSNISGKRDSVLIDTFITVEQAKILVDWVAASGKNLTTIYVTTATISLASERSSIVFPMPGQWATPDVVKLMRQRASLMTEKLFVMELIPSGVFDDLPIDLNVWSTRLSEILDMSLSIILFFECG